MTTILKAFRKAFIIIYLVLYIMAGTSFKSINRIRAKKWIGKSIKTWTLRIDVSLWIYKEDVVDEFDWKRTIGFSLFQLPQP